MENSKKQQARNLFAETSLNKTQIAVAVGVTRRTITSWAAEGSWERLRRSGRHMPAIITENIYHLIGQLTENYVSDRRISEPIGLKEANVLYRLASTIAKLRNRSTLNESVELLGFFMYSLRDKDPKLAEAIHPHIDQYLSHRANIYRTDLLPETYAPMGSIPLPSDIELEEELTERKLDIQDRFSTEPDGMEAYDDDGKVIPFNDAPAQPAPAEPEDDDTTPTSSQYHVEPAIASPLQPTQPQNARPVGKPSGSGLVGVPIPPLSPSPIPPAHNPVRPHSMEKSEKKRGNDQPPIRPKTIDYQHKQRK